MIARVGIVTSSRARVAMGEVESPAPLHANACAVSSSIFWQPSFRALRTWLATNRKHERFRAIEFPHITTDAWSRCRSRSRSVVNVARAGCAVARRALGSAPRDGPYAARSRRHCPRRRSLTLIGAPGRRTRLIPRGQMSARRFYCWARRGPALELPSPGTRDSDRRLCSWARISADPGAWVAEQGTAAESIVAYNLTEISLRLSFRTLRCQARQSSGGAPRRSLKKSLSSQ
jgi:hypothetical protein